jgi:hypothetical protein
MSTLTGMVGKVGDAGQWLSRIPRNIKESWLPFIFTMVLCYVVVIAMTVYLTDQPTGGFSGEAATLAFMTSLAVAIERIQEVIWYFIGLRKGKHWPPLAGIREEAKQAADDLDAALTPLHQNLTSRLTQLLNVLNPEEARWQQVKDRLDQAQAEFAKMHTHLAALELDGPNEERLRRARLLEAAASRYVTSFSEKYEDVQQMAGEAEDAFSGLQEFLATFKDNPGRRLISLFLGGLLGIGVAGLFGLDLFRAVLGTQAEGIMVELQVIATGMIIGLGAGPTHEVVRLLQEYKEKQKGLNRGSR